MIFLIILVLPILSVPFYFLKSLSFKIKNLFIFSLIFSLFCSNTIPYNTDDLTRYYEVYENLKTVNFSAFLAYLILSRDFIIYAILYFFAFLGIPAKFIVFISLFTSLSISLFILKSSTSNIKHSLFFRAFLFVLFFMIVDFRGSILGVRFAMATSVSLLALYYYFTNYKPIKAFSFFILAGMIHFSMFLPFLLLSLDYFKIGNIKFIRFLSLLSLLFIILNINFNLGTVFLAFGDYLPIQFSNGIIDYFFADNSLEYSSINSYVNVFLFIIIPKLFFIISLFLFFFNLKKLISGRFFYYFIIFISLFNEAPILQSRYLSIFSVIITLEVLKDMSSRGLKRTNLVPIAFSVSMIFISFLLNLYLLRDNVFKSFPKYAFMSLPELIINPVSEEDYIQK